MDYKFIRDQVSHQLVDVGLDVTNAEIYATVADIERDIGMAIRSEDQVVRETVTYEETNQYYDLNDLTNTVHEVKAVSIVNDDGDEEWYNLVYWRNVETRNYFGKEGIDYVYIIGNILYLSWEVSDDTDIRIYYMPILNDGDVVASDTDIPDIVLSRVTKFGVLADLFLIHARTEAQIAKANLLQRKYLSLLGQLQREKESISQEVEFSEIMPRLK